MTSYVYYNKQRGNWIIQKSINGKKQHFGSFKGYEDAVKHRDYCIEHEWSDDCKLNIRGKPNPRVRIAKMFNVDIKELHR